MITGEGDLVGRHCNQIERFPIQILLGAFPGLRTQLRYMLACNIQVQNE